MIPDRRGRHDQPLPCRHFLLLGMVRSLVRVPQTPCLLVVWITFYVYLLIAADRVDKPDRSIPSGNSTLRGNLRSVVHLLSPITRPGSQRHHCRHSIPELSSSAAPPNIHRLRRTLVPLHLPGTAYLRTPQ